MKNLPLFLIAVLVTGLSAFVNAQPGPPPSCAGIQPENWNYSYNSNAYNNLSFTDSSVAAPGWRIDYWIWNFGDGSGGFGQNADHRYFQGGNYNVCLIIIASDTAGNFCSDTLCQQINIQTPPPPNCQAYFNLQFTPNFGGVQFTSLCSSADSIVSFAWNFGDGTSSDANNPSHTYANSGVYNVCLSIATVSGCTSTFCDSVRISGSNPCNGVNANWTYVAMTNVNGGIQFSASDTVDGLRHDWNFGDGDFGFGNDPTHTYSDSGTYHVCLTVYAQGCVDSFCQNIHVTVAVPSTCHANFTFQGTQPFGGIQFTSTSLASDSILYYSWGFGDGTSSDIKNPLHTYENAGTYYACLRIQTYSGCVSYFCDSVTINPVTNPCNGVNAYWYSTATSNGGVQFTAYDTAGGATHHDWNFGDGSAEGFGPNPTHNYAASGTYRVCQYVYLEGNGGVICNDSFCKDIEINAGNNCNNFTITISDMLDPQPPGQLLEAHFSGGTSTSVTYKWSTGSDDASIQITQSGVYCVTATSGNCTARTCDSVSIAPPNCTANFTYKVLPTFGNVQFTNTSTAPDSIVSYSWYFGDNTSSTGKNPLHVFANGGYYNVCLRIQTTTGCVNYHCDSIYISGTNPCTGVSADWTYRSSTNGSIQFAATDTANGATHHDWNFGDGSAEGFGASPSHTYTASGYYYVCQYVYVEGTNAVLCVDSSCKYIQVTVPNNCNGFGVTISDIIEPNDPAQTLVAVVSGSTASGAKYKWSTGATSSSIQVTANGTYCVTVTNANNCTASSCDTVVFANINPCDGLTASWTNTTLQGGSVHFIPTDTASGNTHHIWSFGDNTSSSDVSPTHTYTGSGTYHVCLYIYIVGNTCVDSLCKNVEVTVGNACDGVHANFTSSISGQTIYLKSTGITAISAEYQWSLDGQKSTVSASYANYYFTNVAYGQHRICLYVYASANSAPCDSLCQSVNIINPCNSITASWTWSVLQNGAIHFTPGDTSLSVNHAWSFGDGTTSGNVDPVHTYSTSGYYRVCLYVYIAGTTCVDSSCQGIQVNVTSSCAGFSAYIQDTPDSVGGGHTLTAHAYPPAAGSAVSTYQWSTNQTGSTIHVTGSGLYCVTATNENCTAVACDSVHTNPGSCRAYFSFTASNTLNGFSFTDLSITSSPVIAWDWTFGDGGSSLYHNPTHSYTSAGTYYVCLTITTATGCTATYCDSLRIKPCTGLSADWTPIYLSNGGVQFNGVTGTTSVYNFWIFDDGTTSTNADPIHYYAQSGLYNVCHIVTVPGSPCSDTSCRSIQAGASTSCHAEFTYLSSTSNNGRTLYFNDASTSNDSIISWTWSFGDGGSSSEKAPSHTYTSSNTTYNVCLTITTAHGCTSIDCDSITVGGSSSNCTASFRWHAISCLTVEFVNTAATGYTFQRWNYGDGNSDTFSNPHHTYTQPGVYTVILDVYYGTTCYAADTMIVALPSCATNDTICGVVFGDANNDGVEDNGETGISGVQVYIGNVSTTTDSNGAYLVILPPGPHYIYIITPPGCIPTLPLNNYGGTVVNAYYINGIGGTYCGYNFGVNCNIVHICGMVFFDSNNNGIQDSTEPGIPDIHLLIIDSSGAVHNAYTNQDGSYCETLPAGLYTITVLSDYPPGEVSPSYIPVDATTGGTTYGSNNFAVYVPAGSCDLSVNITPRSCVSPGFPAWYSVEVCNVGANPTGGTVDMYYDPSLVFDYSYPAPASQNSSTNTISWPVNNLSPGQCAYYWVAFTAPAPLQIGQSVMDVATVSTSCADVNLANNVDSLPQTVRGSWDPNNKQVNPVGEGTEGLIRGTEELTYSINFQNTGNAPAVNIVVQDAIPGYLDMNTFRMVSSNPPFTSMQFQGNQVSWKFSDVLLPDSAADPTNSHGYVSFAITPVAGLPQGTQIMNSGNVFFDYNSGMVTQSTLNTVDYALAVKDLQNNNLTITLQPNPFSEFTMVKIDGAAASYELKVFDMLGNVVNDQFTENNLFRVERGSMAAGVYIYQVVQQNKVIGMGKMIAQ